MQREKYYEVPENSWLLGQRPPAPGERQKPEELVRQWCAFELMRAYGFQLSDLEFERSVKVGSKNYRIDILVLRDGKPFAVVECKEREHRNAAQGMEQAISYAAARDIGCEFAAYTNGTDWLVSRSVRGIWTAVVDFPTKTRTVGSGSIDELLNTIQKVSPILYKLDEPIAAAEAKAFFAALQRFFHGPNQLTYAFDKHLRSATDNLLRVISGGMANEHYRSEKLSAAAHGLESFRERRAIGHPITGPFAGADSRMFFAEICGGVEAMLGEDDVQLGPDVLLLRLNVALLEYGRSFAAMGGNHPAIMPEIHHTLRDVLAFGFAADLGVHLPSALELKTRSDMKHYCHSAWENCLSEQTRESAESTHLLVWQFLRGIFRRKR